MTNIDSAVEELLLDKSTRFERFDSVNEVLTICTLKYELTVSLTSVIINSVQFNENVIDAFYGIPLNRTNIFKLEYNLCENLPKEQEESILKVLEYYRSLK